jgi:hypothetical protein
MLNPHRPDQHLGSFGFDVTTGLWADFAVSNASGRWPVSLVRFLDRIEHDEACRRLESLVGRRAWELQFGDRYKPLSEAEIASAPVAPKFQKAAEPSSFRPIVVPPEAEGGLEVWLRQQFRGRVEDRWLYRNAEGRVLFAVSLRLTGSQRTRKPKKEFTPVCLVIDPRFPHVPPFWATGQRWPRPLPLYRLDQIAARPETGIVIPEGEKCAEAAARIFPSSIATTSSQGACSAHKSDWSALRGRDVLVWPDNDKAGQDYAAAVVREVMPGEARRRIRPDCA